MKNANITFEKPIWVIIPAYNGKELLSDCISSVKNSLHECNILIVDNASTDGTSKEYIEALGADYIKNEANLGFGAACNIGIVKARANDAEFAVILNQDALLEQNCVSILKKALLNTGDCAIASPLIYDQNDKLYKSFSHWLIGSNNEVLNDAISGDLKTSYQVDFVNAACWMFKLEALEEFGGFDPIFFMYQEDKELASRAHYYGYHTRVCIQAKVTHHSVLTARRSTFKDRLKWYSTKPLSNMIGATRNYSRPFWRNHPKVIADWVSGFVAIILSGNLTMGLAYILAATKFLYLSPQNLKHFSAIKERQTKLFLDIQK